MIQIYSLFVANEELRAFFAKSKDGSVRLIKVGIEDGKSIVHTKEIEYFYEIVEMKS